MARWTIAELSRRVADALDETDYEAPENGQIRAVPKPRTIRYYTTLGLLDRPAAMDGRTALYDERHLAQLVAIKQLQSAGKPLAEIQATLAGATDDELRRIARLPNVAGQGGELTARPARRDDAFWMSEPAGPSESDSDELDDDAGDTPGEPEIPDAPIPSEPPAPRAARADTHQTIEVAPGLLLVVDLRQHPTHTRALERAASAIAAALGNPQ